MGDRDGGAASPDMMRVIRIEQMFAYVVEDDDGYEGVPAYADHRGLPMPLMGADMNMAEKLRPVAQACADGLNKSVRLIRFSERHEVEALLPRKR